MIQRNIHRYTVNDTQGYDIARILALVIDLSCIQDDRSSSTRYQGLCVRIRIQEQAISAVQRQRLSFGCNFKLCLVA